MEPGLPGGMRAFTLSTMTALRILVLGTRNRKKGLELAALFRLHGFDVQTLGDFADSVEVVEDGDSFAANARLKATQQSQHLHQWVLGEDSGIVVDALGGAPGIHSARYSGLRATDESNNQRMLEQLGDTSIEQRTAHYVCHMTISDPEGTIRAESEAYCHGRIRLAAAGNAGFGYDPLFEIVEYQSTFGQLGDTVKQLLSHRARAARQLIPQMRNLVQSGAW